MKTFSTFTQEKQTELFNKHKAFFAFGDSQFNEQKEDGVKYVSLGHGLIVPKLNVKNFNEEWNTMIENSKVEYLKTYKKKDIIWMELGNHESHISCCWESAYIAVSSLGITKEEVAKVYTSFFNYQVKHDNF
jgi:hypothetical protein